VDRYVLHLHPHCPPADPQRFRSGTFGNCFAFSVVSRAQARMACRSGQRGELDRHH
jgi:hypothetical protein